MRNLSKRGKQWADGELSEIGSAGPENIYTCKYSHLHISHRRVPIAEFAGLTSGRGPCAFVQSPQTFALYAGVYGNTIY